MITAERLSKRYGAVTALDDVSFTVRPGVVTGFLGPNGAGKSTTLRLMLGLDRGKGRTTFNGRTYAELPAPTRAVGVLLDAKSVHPARTARNHLAMVAAGAGISRSRVGEVLSLVGLEHVATRRIGGFSLGMHQRLGLATALLGDPEHLILDEPANGLDPEGVQWMRRFLRDLAAEGRTVLASSHLLSEMSMLADDLIVIGAGKLIAAQPTREFIATHTRSEVVVRTPHADQLEGHLRQSSAGVQRTGPHELVCTGIPSDALRTLAERSHIAVHELHTRESSLEEAFLAATATATQYRGTAA